MKLIIKAHIHLLATEDDGRKSFIKSGIYRPNFVFDDKNTFFNTDGEIFIEASEGEIKFPGDIFKCEIKLMDSNHIEHLIYKGRQFFFREGLKKVGEGVIIELMNKD
jgi:translation elongation factor EF-Tu-like GTPase